MLGVYAKTGGADSLSTQQETLIESAARSKILLDNVENTIGAVEWRVSQRVGRRQVALLGHLPSNNGSDNNRPFDSLATAYAFAHGRKFHRNAA